VPFANGRAILASTMVAPYDASNAERQPPSKTRGAGRESRASRRCEETDAAMTVSLAVPTRVAAEGAERLRRLRSMLLARTFEAALLRQPKPGFQLLSRGEEAVAVGICSALELRDPLLCSGRSIGPALARGVPPGGLLAELIGKDGGPNRGRAGRAHVSMPSVGFFGAHGVVGGNLTVAAGVALAQQQLGTGAVAVCLFGDGACGAGALHETLNMAALWRLPLVLACCNNGYAVSTSVREALAPARLIDLAAPFGVPATAVDGTDVDAVATMAREAVASARAGGGPRFLELQCVRMAPHSTLTREERPPVELQELEGRDPLLLYERRLRTETLLDDALWARLRAEVDSEVSEAERFAEFAPWPDGETAELDA
jgi:TPP-dependent pyruvate/acetoin dehydrogenase alpha subunit